jgi:hypothetical protein
MRGELILRERTGLINRDARLPIARTAAGVGDGENADALRIVDVKDQIRESLENAFTNMSTAPTGIAFRVFANFNQRRNNFRVKIECDFRSRVLLIIG